MMIQLEFGAFSAWVFTGVEYSILNFQYALK